MFHPDDIRYRYAVNVKTYRADSVTSWTQHSTLRGAIRSARSLIGGRKYRVKDMERCHIWDKHTNRIMTVADAERNLTHG